MPFLLFFILLDTSQFLQYRSQVGLLPGAVSHAKVAKLSGGGVDGPTQLQLADDAAGRHIHGLAQQSGDIFVVEFAVYKQSFG